MIHWVEWRDRSVENPSLKFEELWRARTNVYTEWKKIFFRYSDNFPIRWFKYTQVLGVDTYPVFSEQILNRVTAMHFHATGMTLLPFNLSSRRGWREKEGGKRNYCNLLSLTIQSRVRKKRGRQRSNTGSCFCPTDEDGWNLSRARDSISWSELFSWSNSFHAALHYIRDAEVIREGRSAYERAITVNPTIQWPRERWQFCRKKVLQKL